MVEMIDYHVTGGRCILRLNNPPLNTIAFGMLDALQAAIERAGDDEDVRSIVITGRDDHFSAGADIHIFETIPGAREAEEISRRFQETFNAVEASAKPVAAAVAGKVMGSALELAAACHVRVCDDRTTFSMPEMNLAIIPGAGGTQRLPRLVGAGKALDMILDTRPVGAEEAAAAGLVDACCAPGDIVATAARLLSDIDRPAITSARADRIADAAENQMALTVAEGTIKKIRPEIVAPRKIVDCVRAAIEGTFDDGLRVERESFAACMEKPAARNKMYLFFSERKAKREYRSAEGEIPDLRTAAVAGMGAMGTGIARTLVTAGVPTTCFDEKPDAAVSGIDRIAAAVHRLVDAGRIPEDRARETLALLTVAADWNGIADPDIVFEAVVENVAAKQRVIAAIEESCREEAVVATNTSTISLDDLAAGMKKGGRLVGFHFFNPAHRMPLVEIVYRDETDQAVVSAAVRLAGMIGKIPVLVKNRPGFIVNRMFVPYIEEAFLLVEEGADPRVVDATMTDFGFPMGPLQTIDMAGLDILVYTAAELRRALDDPRPASLFAERLVDAGFCGQKAGAGVYRYKDGDRRPLDHPAAAEIVAAVRDERKIRPRPVDGAEISLRLLLRMINEAFAVLGEKIAARESDIDLASVLGMGFPDYHGGALKYARDFGLRAVASGLDSLVARCGPRFTPCAVLKNLKGE